MTEIEHHTKTVLECLICKRLFISKQNLLTIPVNKINIELIISTTYIIVTKFDSIINTSDAGFLLNPPLIKISVNEFKIRQWKNIPSFFYINVYKNNIALH